MRKHAIVFIGLCSQLAFIILAGIQAPQKPNFSGTWKFNPAKSKLQIPPPDSGVFRIDSQEPPDIVQFRDDTDE